MTTPEQPPVRTRSAPRYRAADVLRVASLTPHMVRVTLGGSDFGDFTVAGPTGHIRIFFPREGERVLRPPQSAVDSAPAATLDRSHSRVYTPRRWDAAAGELDVDVLVHGEGPGSRWASGVQAGDAVVITGPSAGGAYHPDPAATWFVLAGDEAAVPAIATILDVLQPGVRAVVLAEVEDEREEQPLTSAAGLQVTWLHRKGGAPGGQLAAALRALTLPDGAGKVWVACEAAAMRDIRRHLLAERGLDRGMVYTHGYWKAGTANHPDHDRGED